MGQNSTLATVAYLQAGRAEARPTGLDAADFAAIVRQHQSMVFSIGCHFLRDAAVAEEIAQEAFLRLHRNLDSIESPSHLTRWLRKVTCRLCIDEIRSRPRQKAVGLDEVAEPAVDSPVPDHLMANHLRALVAELPEGMRMTVILRYQEDMDLAEIAAALDVPVNTVKSRLQRGLAILRARISRRFGAIP